MEELTRHAQIPQISSTSSVSLNADLILSRLFTWIAVWGYLLATT